mmetsp:Transcript_71405/g.232027  ORF Transcript_71405/g.232027 Transcript_71405/m.232027 type:complete len:85 (+) Transcript_71405:463-717(+)
MKPTRFSRLSADRCLNKAVPRREHCPTLGMHTSWSQEHYLDLCSDQSPRQYLRVAYNGAAPSWTCTFVCPESMFWDAGTLRRPN